MANPIEAATLYFRAGSSDKVYYAAIEPAEGGYVVNFAYGKRGATLKTGEKTKGPVPLEQARKVYEKLVSEKTGKGYQPGEPYGDYVPAEQDIEVVGGQAQLQNAITQEEAEALVRDDDFFAQEKKDGIRLMVGRQGDRMYALNRKGKPRGFPKEVEQALSSIPGGDFLLDGEGIGACYYPFDILSLAGSDLRPLSAVARYEALLAALEHVSSEHVELVPMAASTEEKQALLERMTEEEKEGLIFKRKSSPYVAGRPSSGGDQLKYKLFETCTARVARINEKRSVALEMRDSEGRWIDVGNVTVKANQNIPEAGLLVEVRYLYAHPGGSLFIPELLGVRDDVSEEDCLIEQLKLKPVEA